MNLLISLAMSVVILLSACPVFAGDTDPSGERLKAVVENYVKTAPPSDETAAKIKSNGSVDSFRGFLWLCSIEMATGVGYFIWDARMKADSCPSQAIATPGYYCEVYSDLYGHWTWQQGKMDSWCKERQ